MIGLFIVIDCIIILFVMHLINNGNPSEISVMNRSMCLIIIQQVMEPTLINLELSYTVYKTFNCQIFICHFLLRFC
jgi:hypothetical protein